MKKVVWFVQLVLLSTVMFLSSDVTAVTPCAPDENGQCIKIEIIVDREIGSGGLIGGGLIGVGGIGGGAGAGAPAYKPNTLKTDRRFCIRSNDTCDGWFLSATSLCGSIFQGSADSYNCAIGADQQRNDSCSALRAANTC
jgi:hypothetical protein